jgi:hypothetical protein
MAIKRILKLTNTEAIIKVDGTVGPITVDLDVDLKLATEEIVGTPTVHIISMQVAGKSGAIASVARNGENLYDLQAGAGELIDYLNIGGTTDSTHATSDIVVTTSGAEGQLILRLRKVNGYRTLIRPEQTGLDTPV